MISAICGAVVAGGGALVFSRWLGHGEREWRGGDRVTGAGNRRELVAELEAAWQGSRRTGDEFGLLLIDVDSFSDINRMHGRAVGDQVLAEVAARIRLRVRDEDFVARVDADEFAVICEHISEQGLEELRSNLRAYSSFAQSAPVTLSIGLATPDSSDTSSLDTLIRARHSLREARNSDPAEKVDDALATLLRLR